MRGFPTQVEWLAQEGMLARSEEEIKAAKREYKRMYKRESKKRQRLAKKEYRPLFGKDEVRMIQAAAKEHGKAVSTFIHDAALAYIAQVFIVPHPDQVRAIERSLARIYMDIRSIKDRMEKRSGNPRLDMLEILRSVEALEKEMSAFLRTPALLTNLVRDAVATAPDLRQTLLNILL
jgi:hypothetical protein